RRQARECLKLLAGLEPWYDTPLIRAISKARELFSGTFKGNKVLFVITDGGDSNFYWDADKDLRATVGKDGRKLDTIERFLQDQFGDQRILFHAVGFEIKDGKFPNRNEEECYKQFVPAVKAIHGKYVDVQSTDELVSLMKEALLQIPFWIEPDSNEYRLQG